MASHRSRLRHASLRLTTDLVPVIVARIIGICAIDTFVLADTWRPVMSIPQSTDTWLTTLRDISTCPFSFYELTSQTDLTANGSADGASDLEHRPDSVRTSLYIGGLDGRIAGLAAQDLVGWRC